MVLRTPTTNHRGADEAPLRSVQGIAMEVRTQREQYKVGGVGEGIVSGGKK